MFLSLSYHGKPRKEATVNVHVLVLQENTLNKNNLIIILINPENAEFPPGIEPGALEFKAVTLGA